MTESESPCRRGRRSRARNAPHDFPGESGAVPETGHRWLKYRGSQWNCRPEAAGTIRCTRVRHQSSRGRRCFVRRAQGPSEQRAQVYSIALGGGDSGRWTQVFDNVRQCVVVVPDDGKDATQV